MGGSGSKGAKKYRVGALDSPPEGGVTGAEQEASMEAAVAEPRAEDVADPLEAGTALASEAAAPPERSVTWRSISGKLQTPCSPPRRVLSGPATAASAVSSVAGGAPSPDERSLRASADASSTDLGLHSDLNPTENEASCPPRAASAVMDEWKRACRRARVPATPLGQLQADSTGSPAGKVAVAPEMDLSTTVIAASREEELAVSSCQDSVVMSAAPSAMELDIGTKPAEQAQPERGRPKALLTPDTTVDSEITLKPAEVAGFWRSQEEVLQELVETHTSVAHEDVADLSTQQQEDLRLLDPGLPSPEFQRQVAELLKERESARDKQQEASHKLPDGASNGATNDRVASRLESASGFDLLPGCMASEGSSHVTDPWVDLVESRRPVPLSALPLLVDTGEDPFRAHAPGLAPLAPPEVEGSAALGSGMGEAASVTSLHPTLNVPHPMSLRSPSGMPDLGMLHAGASDEHTPTAEVALAFPWRQGTRSLLSCYAIQSLKQPDAQSSRRPGRSSTEPSPGALPPCPGSGQRIEPGPNLFPSDRALKACGSVYREGIALPPLGGHDHKMRKVVTEDTKKKVHFGERENWATKREVESTGHRRRGWKNPLVKDRRDER